MRPVRLPALCALCALALLAAGAAQAQRIYRIIEPNGRVTFTDRPPTADARDITLPLNVQRPGGDAPLPPLRPAGQRPPVTLYTAADCMPCVSARALLEQRGVAFTERVVASVEDLQALQRLSGDATLPFATVGEQQLKGFSQQEWGSALDAAGYAPRTRPAPPAPAITVAPTAPAAPPAPAARPGEVPQGPAAPAVPLLPDTPATPAS